MIFGNSWSRKLHFFAVILSQTAQKSQCLHFIPLSFSNRNKCANFWDLTLSTKNPCCQLFCLIHTVNCPALLPRGGLYGDVIYDHFWFCLEWWYFSSHPPLRAPPFKLKSPTSIQHNQMDWSNHFHCCLVTTAAVAALCFAANPCHHPEQRSSHHLSW